MAVRLLPDTVINQIAAGEVVERPASVVKELVENALDAGAKRLVVQLRAGGKDLVRISDDGSGMGRDDALMSLERHATSKIYAVTDLEKVVTLGFRGEAIPSIASVSRFRMLTRPAADAVGTEIRIEGGRLVDVSDGGGPGGTEMEVRDLFFNLPARRKFLRTEPTELSHCVEAVLREVLVRPDVDILVKHEGREILSSRATDDPRLRLADLLDVRDPREIREFAVEEGDIAIRGFAVPPPTGEGSGAAGWTWVNGRHVRDPLIRRAVVQGLEEAHLTGRPPRLVLLVTIPPEEIDVNVHPAKTELRFRDPRAVAQLVQRAVLAGVEARAPLRARSPDAGPGLFAPPTVFATTTSSPWGPQPTTSAMGWRPAISPHPDDDPRVPVGRGTVTQAPPEEVTPRGGVPQAPPEEEHRQVPVPAARPDAPPLGWSTTHRQAARAAAFSADLGAGKVVRLGDGLALVAGDPFVYVDIRGLAREEARDRWLSGAQDGGVADRALLVPLRVTVGAALGEALGSRAPELAQLGLHLSTPIPGEVLLRRIPSFWPTALDPGAWLAGVAGLVAAAPEGLSGLAAALAPEMPFPEELVDDEILAVVRAFRSGQEPGFVTSRPPSALRSWLFGRGA